MLLNNKWIIEEIKVEMNRFLETNYNEDTITHNLWDTAKHHWGGVYNNKVLYQEERKVQIYNIILYLKQLEK